jgi:hypothetical protein
MSRHRGPVLVDTNVILECWRTGSWRALAGGYGVETVEECIMETQTGFQRRRKEEQIDVKALRGSLAAVHSVGPKVLAEAILRDSGMGALDVGERSLWAHALTRTDGWILCGPDKASLRIGIRLGFRERLTALESLLDAVGHRPRVPLRMSYTAAWHRTTLAELGQLEEGRSK